VLWNTLTIFPFSLGIIIPTDFHIFSTCSSQLNGKIIPTEWEESSLTKTYIFQRARAKNHQPVIGHDS
jgi:hypothetical protein